MKILAINGSYRGEKGQTNAFLELLLSGAREEGAECEIVALAKHKIHHCLSCDTCHTPNHYLKCVYSEKDDAASVFDKIATADLLVYATPVYVFGISSLLKTFIERFYSTCDVNQFRVTKSGLFFHHIDEKVCSKDFVSLICCDNLDKEMPINTRDYFRIYSRFMDAKHVGELIRNGGRLFQRGQDKKEENRFPAIAEVYAAYKQAGRELVIDGHIHARTQKRANQEIIPVSFFGQLKKLKPFKKVMVQRAKELFSGN